MMMIFTKQIFFGISFFPKTLIPNLRLVNKSFLLLLCFIAGIGFVVLYSAAEGHWVPWASKQVLRFFIGLIFLLLIAVTDLRFWLSQSYLLYAISFLLLVGVEVLGKIGMGGQRWIDLYFFIIQPSEIMKITLMMALARYFHNLSPLDFKRFHILIPPILMILIPAILVARQPDLDTLIIFMCSGLSIFWVAGIRLKHILIGGSLALGTVPLLWHFLYEYQKQRILTFLNPEGDPLGKGYQILQSKIALGSGGWFGKGFGAGTQSHLKFLPTKQTDFIFSMLCEEFGILTGFVLIVLYLILVIHGYRISLQSRSSYGRYLGIGLTTLFFLYVFVNISMVMGLMPVVGIPLPLVSYGGTAMLTILMVQGFLISISLHHHHRISSC